MDWDWNSEKSFDGYDDYNDYYDGYDNDYYDPGDSEGQEEYNFDSSTDFELRQGQGQASTEQDGRKSKCSAWHMTWAYFYFMADL
eukprot:m.226063 g.226063  ORF g.226063 m.226063 type:complete len:85 (+) comp40024_c0_seq14:667-921(+)